MLRWDWNKKIGVLKFRNYRDETIDINIYRGNALMIFIHEPTEDTYKMFSFFADKQHLKNLLEEPEYFKNWDTIKLWELDNDTFQAIKSLYKAGVEIELIHPPF